VEYGSPRWRLKGGNLPEAGRPGPGTGDQDGDRERREPARGRQAGTGNREPGPKEDYGSRGYGRAGTGTGRGRVGLRSCAGSRRSPGRPFARLGRVEAPRLAACGADRANRKRKATRGCGPTWPVIPLAYPATVAAGVPPDLVVFLPYHTKLDATSSTILPAVTQKSTRVYFFCRDPAQVALWDSLLRPVVGGGGVDTQYKEGTTRPTQGASKQRKQDVMSCPASPGAVNLLASYARTSPFCGPEAVGAVRISEWNLTVMLDPASRLREEWECCGEATTRLSLPPVPGVLTVGLSVSRGVIILPSLSYLEYNRKKALLFTPSNRQSVTPFLPKTTSASFIVYGSA